MCSSHVSVHEDGASGRAQLSRWLTGFLGLPCPVKADVIQPQSGKCSPAGPSLTEDVPPPLGSLKASCRSRKLLNAGPLGPAGRVPAECVRWMGTCGELNDASQAEGFLGSGAQCRALRPEAPEPRGAGGNTVALGFPTPCSPRSVPLHRCVAVCRGGEGGPVFVQLGLGVTVQQHWRMRGTRERHQCPEGHVLTDDAETARAPQLRGLTVSAGHCGRRCFSECWDLSVI